MNKKIVRIAFLQEQEIVKLYTDGYGSYTIGKMFDVSCSRILYILHKYGISKNNNKYYSSALNNEQIETMISLYDNVINIRQLGNIFNIWPNAIKGLLQRRGIKIRQCSRPKIIFREAFLNQIDIYTAYFYGFILGDGSFSESKKHKIPKLKIALSIKDRGILNMFCDWMDMPKSHLIELKKVNQVQLDISSNNIGINKNLWGLIRNKTYNPLIPELKDKVLLKYFLIGLIDADGHVVCSKKKGYKIELVGNKKIMNWVEEMFRFIGFKGFIKKDIKDDVVWSRLIVGRKKDVIELSKILDISNCNFLLKRKWEPVKNYLSSIS